MRPSVTKGGNVTSTERQSPNNPYPRGKQVNPTGLRVPRWGKQWDEMGTLTRGTRIDLELNKDRVCLE